MGTRIALLLGLLAPIALAGPKIDLTPRWKKGEKTFVTFQFVKKGSTYVPRTKNTVRLFSSDTVEYIEEVSVAKDGKPIALTRKYLKSRKLSPPSNIEKNSLEGKTIGFKPDGKFMTPANPQFTNPDQATLSVDWESLLPRREVEVGEEWTLTRFPGILPATTIWSGTLRCTLREVKTINGDKVGKIDLVIESQEDEGIALNFSGTMNFSSKLGKIDAATLRGQTSSNVPDKIVRGDTVAEYKRTTRIPGPPPKPAGPGDG